MYKETSQVIFFCFLIKGGEAYFSFRHFEPDFLHQYLLKY